MSAHGVEEETKVLDLEWVKLIEEALCMGISAEEIKMFLEQHQKLVST